MGVFKIVVIILVASIIILFIIRKKGNKQDMLSYISTLMATLFGVLLAVALSNNANKIKENKDAIKLINTANTIVTSTYDYTKGIHDYVNELAKDSISGFEKIEIVIASNPLPYPEMLQTTLTNEIVSKHISEFMQVAIYNNLYNLRKTCNFEDIYDYENVLEELKLALQLENDYQKGTINLEIMKERYYEGLEKLDDKYSIYNKNTIDYNYNKYEK